MRLNKNYTPFWKRLKFQKNVLPWLFILPVSIVHFVVVVYPVAQGFYFSFTEWSGIGEAEFIGLGNFQRLIFEDVNFRLAFRNNLIWMVIWLTIPFILALAVASVLARIKRAGIVQLESRFRGAASPLGYLRP